VTTVQQQTQEQHSLRSMLYVPTTLINKHLVKPFFQTEASLSREAIAYWISFAASGNPSTSKLSTSPLWTTFLASGSGSNSTQLVIPFLVFSTCAQLYEFRYRMVLTEANSSSSDATASGMEQVPTDEAQRCAFWMREDITAQTRI
jgi:hypothetical protein